MTKLDEQLEAGLCGDFVTGQRIADELEVEMPKCPAGAFNRGWYELRKGNLQKGHNLLDCGRHINVFGNRHVGSTRPIWNGETGATVLLNLEGGLGDQINGVRFARNIASYGNKVIVCCLPELSELFIDCEGVSAIVQPEACLGVYHDFWLPSMSAIVPLKLEYKDLCGKPYIKRKIPSEGKVGVRWLGNPEFEHQQHRVFPKELMFDAVRDQDSISLQKDGEIPEWMEKPSLNNWEDTRKQISRCDLVITSCTSIAHLAGAMGTETFIVVPILSYYLWALPVNTTPYYDSVTLFRQEKYSCWEAPFMKIKSKLNKIKQRMVA